MANILFELLEIFVIVDEKLNGGLGDEDGDGVPLVVVVQRRLVAAPLGRDLKSNQI